MKPIEIKIHCCIQRSSQEICSIVLNTDNWTKFEGYFLLPGIEKAFYETKTPNVVGSRIQVHNKDGSSHVEEIIEWDTAKRLALKFQNFDSPLRNFATHFIEVWNFSISNNGTKVERSMTMYPKGFLGWLLLLPISKLMKKALEKGLKELS